MLCPVGIEFMSFVGRVSPGSEIMLTLLGITTVFIITLLKDFSV
jgi:hypothetical protein